MSIRSRLANALRPRRLHAELDEEIQFHLEQRVNQLVAAGMGRREAQEQARRRFGNRLQLREASQDAKSARWLGSILQDVRFGCRMLWKDRTAMAAAVLSLALALGACATAFSLIDALILRPLPVTNAEQLFYLAWPDREARVAPGASRQHSGFSYPLFEHMRAAAGSSLDLFGANWPVPLNPVVIDAATGERELVRIAALSGNGFGVLGIKPAAGRLLNEEDDAHSATDPVAVISHAFWVRRFAGDPRVAGRTISIGDRTFRIVGIVEKDFSGLQHGYLNDVWIPLTAMVDAKTLASPGAGWIGIWGHMKGEPQAAQQALQAVFTSFRRDHVAEILPPGASAGQVSQFLNAPLLINSSPSGADSLFRLQFTRPLWIFGIFSGLLLLIAASNVANLLIARAAAREREMALRVAIGAGRGRLIRQLLIESGILAGLACTAALALATAAAPFLARQLGPSTLPSYLDIGTDWRLLSFLCLAGLLTTLLFGSLPALRASAVLPAEALKNSAPGSGRGALRPLVPLQVAFSFMVLFISGLLLVSFNRLLHVKLGFTKDHVLLLTVNTKGLNPQQQQQAALEVLDRVRRVGGVRGASLSQQAPMGGAALMFVMNPFLRFPGRPPETIRPANVPVSAGFFETMQIRLLQGREFEPRDMLAGTASAAIVNEAFVQQFLPGRNPLGERFEIVGDSKPMPQEVVGVVGNSLFHDLREGVVPTIYSPVRNLNGATLEVRTEGNPLALASTLRQAVETAHPGLRVRATILQSTRIEDALVSERLLAWLGGFFAAAAMVLVSVGLHATISYFVVRRTREIGIRMALGAERGAVVRFVVGDAAILVSIGIVLGIVSAIPLARSVASLLFDVKLTDFRSVALPLLCLLAAGVVAALRPALRAVRVDPVIALRYE
jgi:predicted permease